MYRFFMLGFIFVFCIQVAEAAWPDSSEGRIQAQDLVRKDLKIAGNTYSIEDRAIAYKEACDLKYYPACNYKTWTDDDGFSNPKKAGEFFSSRCKSDGLSCTVSAWAYGYLNGKPSNKALNSSKAFQDLTYGCTQKKYGPACSHLGELYMMGVGTNIDYQRAKELFQEGCDAKDQYGCYLEADLYYHGWGILQDYVIAMQKYTDACNAGFLDSCTKIGFMNEYGQGTEQDFGKAAQIYQKNCELGYTQACVRLGKLNQAGRGVVQDSEKAASFFAAACKTKDKYGCYLGGDLYADEWSGDEDLGFVQKQLINGCKQGNVQSCSELGEFYEQGRGGEPDVQKSYRYYDQACSKNNPNGCAHLARLLVSGKGAQNAAMTGFEIFKFLCGNGDARGCYGVGEFFELGRGMPKDIKVATMLYGQACDSGYAKACSSLGVILLASSQKEEISKGFEIVKKSCGFGDFKACLSLADLYMQGFSQAGVIIEKDQEQAKKIFVNACEQETGLGCYQLAKISEKEENEAQATQFYEKACQYDHSESCRILGVRHLTGKGVPVSIENAAPFFLKGCGYGDRLSCEKIAAFYEEGKGVTKDISLALERHKQACGLSSANSCLRAGQIIQENAADEKQGFRDSVTFFDQGCKLGNQESCTAAEPLLFLSKYDEIVLNAFNSETCEVVLSGKGASQNRKYVEANKDKFTVYTYADAGEITQTFQARHKETNFTEGGSTRTAQSYWELVSAEQIILVEHHENWFFNRVDIQDFPGKDSFSRDEKDGKSIYYSRKNGTLRRYTESKCRFVNDISSLKASYCSEVQALIAAQLVSVCFE